MTTRKKQTALTPEAAKRLGELFTEGAKLPPPKKPARSAAEVIKEHAQEIRQMIDKGWTIAMIADYITGQGITLSDSSLQKAYKAATSSAKSTSKKKAATKPQQQEAKTEENTDVKPELQTEQKPATPPPVATAGSFLVEDDPDRV